VVTPERRRRILELSLPILGGMVSQNLLDLIDTLMVGHLKDADSALAAVNLGAFANFTCFSFVAGLSMGVQALAARRVGEGRDSETAVPLNGGLLLVAALSIPLTVLLFALAPRMLGALSPSPEVVGAGTAYLRARLVGTVAIGANFAFRGYWSATNRARIYLRTIVAMHVVNVILNWVFIYGHLGAPALGPLGSGVATTIATFAGLAMNVGWGLKLARPNGFLRGLPDRPTLRQTLRLSLPAGVQQFLFAAGMTTFFGMVGHVGTAEVAASSVLFNILKVAVLPGLGFGLGAASLVGQALGRGDVDDARRWAWDVVKLAMAVVAVLSLPGALAPDFFLSFFLKEPATRALAVAPLCMVAISLPLDTVGMVLFNALLGAGDARRVMLISVCMQYAVQLPLVFLVAFRLGGGMLPIWIVQTGYRLVQAGLFAGVWRTGRWAQVRV
jgi:putative MATE family efflux protein